MLFRSTWQIAATVRWNEFIDRVRQMQASHYGLVAFETAFGPEETTGQSAMEILATDWTFPLLSIALAPHGRVAMIIGNPPSCRWQYCFNVTRSTVLPRVAGIDYSDYLTALRASSSP